MELYENLEASSALVAFGRGTLNVFSFDFTGAQARCLQRASAGIPARRGT